MTELETYLRPLGRKALVAEELELDSLVDSCQGGVPLGSPGERWPTNAGAPLFPVLTICTAELPFVPPVLDGSAYWTFFIEPDLFEQVVAGLKITQKAMVPEKPDPNR